MRLATVVKVDIPDINRTVSIDILENFGISVSKTGFVGLPEDLDFFFAQEMPMVSEMQDAFQIAKQKWEDGDIAYL
jgi:hypothetical protein